ncbi:hypothetical protein M3J09_001290 [Ascochyta lentis]
MEACILRHTYIATSAAMQRPIAAASRFSISQRAAEPLVMTAHSLPPPHAAHDIRASSRFSRGDTAVAILNRTDISDHLQLTSHPFFVQRPSVVGSPASGRCARMQLRGIRTGQLGFPFRRLPLK